MFRFILVVALVTGFFEAVPVNADATTGAPVIDEAADCAPADDPQPKKKSSQDLLAKWQKSARLTGDIPGGMLQSLVDVTENFVRLNSTDERVPKLKVLLKRMDVSHDWTVKDTVQLLDDVTDVYDLAKWALESDRFSTSKTIRTGKPLPKELNDAPWGNAEPNGLRTAWLLDPVAKEHRLITPLKSRILFHNSSNMDNGIGQARTIVFRAETWNQGTHAAKDTNGKPIKVDSTYWTTIPQVIACRLAPGEFLEVIGAGIGVGENENMEDWRHTRVGSWIHAKAGDDVTFVADPVSLNGDFTNARAKGDSEWWRKFVSSRLKRDSPLPDDAAERTRLLDRAMRDLFGQPATPEQAAKFVADKSSKAFENLVDRLATRRDVVSFVGKLQSGESNFRVLPVDPAAAKRPRVAIGPGRYQLNKKTTLVIVGRSRNGVRVADAHLEFTGDDGKTLLPKKHTVELPVKQGPYGIAWERGETTYMWVAQKGILRRCDFADVDDIKEKRIEPKPGDQSDIYLPEAFREPLRKFLNGPKASGKE